MLLAASGLSGRMLASHARPGGAYPVDDDLRGARGRSPLNVRRVQRIPAAFCSSRT